MTFGIGALWQAGLSQSHILRVGNTYVMLILSLQASKLVSQEVGEGLISKTSHPLKNAEHGLTCAWFLLS